SVAPDLKAKAGGLASTALRGAVHKGELSLILPPLLARAEPIFRRMARRWYAVHTRSYLAPANGQRDGPRRAERRGCNGCIRCWGNCGRGVGYREHYSERRSSTPSRGSNRQAD